MPNLCIQSGATASGSVIDGTAVGVPNNIRDDSLVTVCGASAGAPPGEYPVVIGYFAEAIFVSTANVSSVDIVHRSISNFNSWAVDLFYSGVYNQVLSGAGVGFLQTTHSTSGSWLAVTKIRLSATASDSSSYENSVEVLHECYELRAWGDLIVVPTVVSNTATAITVCSAILNGSIADTGGATCFVRGFDWGINTSYGYVVTSSGSFGISAFLNTVADLNPATIYHCRAKAVNLVGTGYGSDVQFVTVGVEEETKGMSRLIYDEIMEYMMEDY